MALTVHPPRFRSERGSELIEFAIVLPIFLLILAGIFDFGMMFRSFEVVTNAAREGARVGVLEGYEAIDIESRIDAYMDAAGLTGPYTVSVATVPVVTTAGTFTARSVSVNYTYQFTVLAGIGIFFGGDYTSIPLQAASVMRTETTAAP